MAALRKVAKWSELGEGKIKAVLVDGDPIALFKIGEEVFATSDACTHDGCSLEEFGQIDGEEVECSCHSARFRIKTGEVTRLPALKPLRTYKVTVEGDAVWVEI